MNIARAVLACTIFVPFVAVAACGDESSSSSSSGAPTPTPTGTTPIPTTDSGTGSDTGTGADTGTGSDTGTDTGTDSALPTFNIRGTVSNAVNAGLVLQLNGANDLAVAANATTFAFTTKVADKAAYSVTLKSLPTQQGCRVQAGSGTVAGADVTNIAIDCSNRTSCKQVHADMPTLPTGPYLVDPDGAGAIPPLPVHCDMTFDDGAGGGAGGWTMILSTSGVKGPTALTEGNTLAGSAAYLPIETMKSFATAASQVHLRSTGKAATESITSKANNETIVNLRAGAVVNEGLTGTDQIDRWTGPFAIPARLQFSCATSSLGWPSVYWACGNFNGLHLVSALSMWDYNVAGNPGENIDMEVYVR